MLCDQVYDAPVVQGGRMQEAATGRIVRFAVRKVVDEDEVHVAWAIGDPGVASAACEVVAVQGLSHLAQRASAGIQPCDATAATMAAALLCAMHKVIVVDSRLPMKYTKKQVRKAVNEIPRGWSVQIDNSDVVDLLECKTTMELIIPYGRFLWPALDGDTSLVTCVHDEPIQTLRNAPVSNATVIQASHNQVAVINSRMGPLIVTRHLVERSMQRLRNLPSVAAAVANIAIRLAAGSLYDATPVFARGAKWKAQYPRSKVYVQDGPHEMIAHVVIPEKDGDTIVTIYTLNARERASVMEFVRHQRTCTRNNNSTDCE